MKTPHSHTVTTKSKATILSPLMAGMVVLFCLVAALLLVPRDQELIERLLEDGKHRRALEVVKQQEGNEVLERALAEKVETLPIAAPAYVLEAPVLEVLRDAVEALASESPQSPPDAGDGVPLLTKALAAIRAAKADELTAAAAVLAGNDHETMPDEARIEIYRALGQRAVGENQARLATGIYGTFCGTGTQPSPAMLSEMMDAAGYAGAPETAVGIAEAYCTAKGVSLAELPDPARTKCVAMLRATNRPGDALDILMAELKIQAAGPEGIHEDLLQTAVETAGHADRITQMVPHLEAFVENLPESQMSLEETVRRHADGSLKLSETYRHYSSMLARYSEWSDRFSLAFDHYIRLAVAGDKSAFDRIAELYDDLNRQHEFMLLLQCVVPVEGEEKFTRLLALLLGDSGLYVESEKWYRTWLAEHQDDVIAWLQLGALLEEEANLEGALATFQGAAKLMETSPPAKRLPLGKRIASLQIALRNFDEPFAFYNKLEDDEHDAVTLENYALLAEGMADYEAYNRALFLRHKRLRKPKTEDFVELARSFAMINDHTNEVRVLATGLKALPQSKLMHIELASGLREMGREQEAYDLLAKPMLRDSMQAMGILIETASSLENCQQAIGFLGRSVEKEFAFSPDVRLDLGHIYEGIGMLSSAEKLYASVPGSPHTWPLLASARFKRGDYASAEDFQRKHLAALAVPDPEGWMFLGDIYRYQGKEGEAESAYKRSLYLMEAKIQIAQ
ncbi:MAG: tetratricopeptide (TPR) repeat protein [Verrucomicrobiales bacterium]|jgi:tetratricopeptide (TPR) repeat protein